jgi:hypothetical protein
VISLICGNTDSIGVAASAGSEQLNDADVTKITSKSDVVIFKGFVVADHARRQAGERATDGVQRREEDIAGQEGEGPLENAADPTYASLDVFGHDRADVSAHLASPALDRIKGSVYVAIISTEV